MPLVFKNEADYERIPQDAMFSTIGVQSLAPKSLVLLNVKPANGEEFDIELAHTMNEGQIEWFKSGSALNSLR